MNRKIFSILLCALLMAMLAIPAFAAGSATVSASNTAPNRGQTFTVTVSISGTGSWSAGALEVKYGSGLELVGAASLANDITISENLAQGRVVFFSLKGAVNISGKLLQLTFKVKSNAAFESNKIDVSLEINGETIQATRNVTVTCQHNYSGWTVSGDKHTRKCSICGKTDTQNHTYDNPCDTDCNACGAKRTTEHDYTEEWFADETGHWHECTHCGGHSTLEAHIPGAEAGEYTDQTCTVCGIVLTPALGHQHSYDGTYLTDGTYHWTKCTSCGEISEKIAHGYDSECDDTCDICGHKRAVLHNAGDQWHCDDEQHWQDCADCGNKVELGAHIWDRGTVTLEATATNPGKILYRCAVCHTERLEEIPVLAFTEALPWWLWLFLGAIGGAIIVLLVQAIAIAVKNSRKEY